jgi:tRNA1Val (adenine37-N6)-methyltransferase
MISTPNPKEAITENTNEYEIVESPINEKVMLKEHKNGFRMGTDSVLLSKFVVATSKENGVDLGTGSGVIPLLLLSMGKGNSITGIEIQESLFELAKENAKDNGFENNFHPVLGDVRNINYIYESEKADFVTMNPPYFKCGSGKTSENIEKVTARHEMNGGLDAFCKAAAFCLKYGGRFYVVYRADRLTELLHAMTSRGIEAKEIVMIHKKGNVETVLVKGVKGAKPGLKISVKETELVKSTED